MSIYPDQDAGRHVARQAEPDVMQRLMGVPRIADSIRAHYGRVPGPDCLNPAAGVLSAELSMYPQRNKVFLEVQCNQTR